MGSYTWHTRCWRNKAMKVDNIDVELLGMEHDHRILWRSDNIPRGFWFYDDHRRKFHIKISGRPDGQEKDHVFEQIANTKTWNLLVDEGSHFHKPGDTVTLIKKNEEEE